MEKKEVMDEIMTVKEIIETQERNYEEEKNIIENLSIILNPYINLNGIKKRLELNGFNGVYILDRKTFSKLENPNTVKGLYSSEEKVIIMNKQSYSKSKRLGVHEMGHAYLDSRNKSIINVDGEKIKYGIGLEEGAMSLLASNNNITDISKRSKNYYPLQSKLFQQLSVLYNNSSISEYENLLVELFLEPKQFLPLIRDIYEDIFKNELPKFDCSLAEKSAFAMVSGTDSLVEHHAIRLYRWLCYLNSLYLNISDKDIRHKNKSNNLFTKSKDFDFTNEETLFNQIFNTDYVYLERQENNLESSLIIINEELERLSDDTKILVR